MFTLFYYILNSTLGLYAVRLLCFLNYILQYFWTRWQFIVFFDLVLHEVFRGFRSDDSSLSRRRPPDLLRRVCRDEVCSKKKQILKAKFIEALFILIILRLFTAILPLLALSHPTTGLSHPMTAIIPGSFPSDDGSFSSDDGHPSTLAGSFPSDDGSFLSDDGHPSTLAGSFPSDDGISEASSVLIG